MKTKIKLSLYIKFKNLSHKINFNVSPTPSDVIHNSDERVYNFDVDPFDIFNLSVNILEIPLGSAVIIDKIFLNDSLLNYLDSFGVYKTKSGTKKTYGYMDQIGSYHFKIRYNNLSQNYLTFLLNS